MINPLVSIIIPTYNYGHLITETLFSVLNQRYTNWECLIIDDGSTDDTLPVVNNFIALHSEYNFRYVIRENRGTSAAKNAGIEQAKGELIQFLDADDLLSPDKLRIQVALMQAHDAALVFSASAFFKIINGRQEWQQKYPAGFLADQSLSGYTLLKRLVINNVVTISSPLVKTSLVRQAGGFDADLKNNEDWILWFKIALLKPVWLCDQNQHSFVHIRIHGNSAMNGHMQMFLGEVRVREEMGKLLRLLLNSDERSSDAHAVLEKLNSDLLALHRIRSLEIGKGFSYIISNFIKNPAENYSLLARGCFKLMVRCYKTVIKHEK